MYIGKVQIYLNFSNEKGRSGCSPPPPYYTTTFPCKVALTSILLSNPVIRTICMRLTILVASTSRSILQLKESTTESVLAINILVGEIGGVYPHARFATLKLTLLNTLFEIVLKKNGKWLTSNYPNRAR